MKSVGCFGSASQNSPLALLFILLKNRSGKHLLSVFKSAWLEACILHSSWIVLTHFKLSEINQYSVLHYVQSVINVLIWCFSVIVTVVHSTSHLTYWSIMTMIKGNWYCFSFLGERETVCRVRYWNWNKVAASFLFLIQMWISEQSEFQSNNGNFCRSFEITHGQHSVFV